MKHKLLVVVLDGASFVFSNTFLWMMPNVEWFFHSFNRSMLYIDEPPVTPCVMNTFFTGKPTREHGVLGFKSFDKPASFCGEFKGMYVWDIAKLHGLKVKVMNVPVKIPTVNLNVDLKGLSWVDAWLPPKNNFFAAVRRFHQAVLSNIRGEWDLFIVWYPIPDQAHHHFFPVVNDENALRTACWWYDLAFNYARQLVEASKPDAWLVLSDHGFTSDFEDYHACGIKQAVHVRDGLAVSNMKELPRRSREVYSWVLGKLGVVEE